MPPSDTKHWLDRPSPTWLLMVFGIWLAVVLTMGIRDLIKMGVCQ